MALPNMIKLKDRVTYGRSGEKKVVGIVVKLNPKTAHIVIRNGDVMSVTYNFIQKPSSKGKKAGMPPRSKPVRKARGRRVCATPVKGKRPKKNPASEAYLTWIEQQPTPHLKKLEKSLKVVTAAPAGAVLHRDAQNKLQAVARELSARKEPKNNPARRKARAPRYLPQIPKGYSDFDSLLSRAKLSTLRKYKDGAQYKRLRPLQRRQLGASIKHREYIMLRDFDSSLLDKVGPIEGYTESMAAYNKIKSSLIKKSKVPGYRGKDARAQLKALRDQVKRQHG